MNFRSLGIVAILGRPGAHRRAGMGRRRDRLSILDMSIEDDSLLPPRPPQDQEMRGAAPTRVEDAPGVAPLPPPARKSKKQHNLRKSLAWDKAFLTGEGVLDPDELPIPARTSPKKLPELPTLHVKATLHDDCCASAAAQGDANRESLRLKSFSERFADSRVKSLDLPQQECPPGQDVPSPVVPRCAPAKKAIESAIEKGTRLRLPSTFIADERRKIPRPSKPQKESNLVKRVTSVSRRVKDTLGRVLPGRVDAVPPAAAVRLSSEVSERETGCSAEFCSASGTGEVPDFEVDTGSCVHTTRGTSSSSEEMQKPTGLRMPSPKLGFFDSGRPPTQHRYATRSAVRIPNGTALQTSAKSKPHGLPKGRPLDTCGTERVSSSIPSAPHLRKVVVSGGQENWKKKEDLDENSASTLNEVPIQQAATRSPLAINAGLLNSGPVVGKEKGSLFALAKKAVGRLSSPVQEKPSNQEKTIYCDEKVSDLEPEPSAVLMQENTKLVKTGPVQHSPPNKPAPQPGPWSPVRKNATQLGPFDCTKSNAQIAWE